MISVFAGSFAEWRDKARHLLSRNISPQDISWNLNHTQESLFGETRLPETTNTAPRVGKDFLPLAFTVSCHRDPERWSLLYQALWRLTNGEKHLLKLATDPVMHALRTMEKQVKRDAHKAKAFVRFRLTIEEEKEHYIAWHEPDHFILPIVTPFFQRRFAVQLWTIMTPDGSVHWNGEALEYGPAAQKSFAPDHDHLEDLWRSYYRATFNPARIKLNMMKSEMPVRYWANLPETSILSEMLEEAPQRVERMLAHQEGPLMSAAEFLPPSYELDTLRAASKGCKGCPLYASATQTVFGTGLLNATLMLVGEQPGDDEDKSGEPFTGPAGRLLDELLEHQRIDRAQLYITNAVKHFKFQLQGKRRIHQSPLRSEVVACHPWLEAEIKVVNPKVVLALGATAAKALLGPGFTLKHHRAQWNRRGTADVAGTYHPSAILRAEGEARESYKKLLAEDLQAAAVKAGML